MGHHGARHGERPLGPEMADADDDDAALDAEVAAGAVDAGGQAVQPVDDVRAVYGTDGKWKYTKKDGTPY